MLLFWVQSNNSIISVSEKGCEHPLGIIVMQSSYTSMIVIFKLPKDFLAIFQSMLNTEISFSTEHSENEIIRKSGL